MGFIAYERKFKCAEFEKRKLKFEEYHGRNDIMGNKSTIRCPYIFEQDRFGNIKNLPRTN